MIHVITQKDYAKIMDVTVQAVSHRLNNNIPLPGITKTEKFRGWWMLYYDQSTDIASAKQSFKVTSGRPVNNKKKKKVA